MTGPMTGHDDRTLAAIVAGGNPPVPAPDSSPHLARRSGSSHRSHPSVYDVTLEQAFAHLANSPLACTRIDVAVVLAAARSECDGAATAQRRFREWVRQNGPFDVDAEALREAGLICLEVAGIRSETSPRVLAVQLDRLRSRLPIDEVATLSFPFDGPAFTLVYDLDGERCDVVCAAMSDDGDDEVVVSAATPVDALMYVLGTA